MEGCLPSKKLYESFAVPRFQTPSVFFKTLLVEIHGQSWLSTTYRAANRIQLRLFRSSIVQEWAKTKQSYMSTRVSMTWCILWNAAERFYSWRRIVSTRWKISRVHLDLWRFISKQRSLILRNEKCNSSAHDTAMVSNTTTIEAFRQLRRTFTKLQDKFLTRIWSKRVWNWRFEYSSR